MDPWYDSSTNFLLWICKLNQSQLNLQICLHYDIVAKYGKRWTLECEESDFKECATGELVLLFTDTFIIYTLYSQLRPLLLMHYKYSSKLWHHNKAISKGLL